MKPRVLLAGNHLSSRGGSRGPIEDLAEKLDGLGYKCLCVSRVRNGIVRGLDLLATAIMRRSGYDVAVVDLYSGRAFWWGDTLSAVLRFMERPFVITLHGGGLPEYAAKRQDRVQRCLARAAAVTAPSRYLTEHMSGYRNGIRLLPNPISLDEYPYRLRSQASPRLVWVRAFHRIYNPSLAVRVMALLPDAELTMVGGDRNDGSFQMALALTDELGIGNRVRFTGAVQRSQVSLHLCEADIFINTTNYDNTPVSVIEAMACGLCVISTNAGGVSYLIEDGVDGLLVPPDEPEAMANAIRSVVNDPTLAKQLSRNGRAKVEKFDWATVLPQWTRLLESVAGSRSSATTDVCATSNF